MSSLLKEAHDLNVTLEGEVLKLPANTEEEKEKKEETKLEAVAATEWCTRVMKRLEDLRAATKVREDGLNKIISDLEVTVKAQIENELNLNSTISLLRKGEGVDWETTIETEDFALIRETLYNLAVKLAK